MKLVWSVLLLVQLATRLRSCTPTPHTLACLLAALDGAQHLLLEGAKHVPIEAKPDQNVHWYGSGDYLEQWIDYLHPPHGSD